ncbi:YrhK family protein [Halogeometricum limi]|uniref:YrhK-like protein n=1 Tax=Halogeometricum limi TaxID=555875 RepID=A0A1I6HIM3_9EURY|nr:YrhK family protein [Halogeometricum limi]SFR54150.1 YrhK-like protein [Halogeometricum limi]
MFKDALRVFFDDYEWIHTSLGIIGNFLFFVGSIMFLYESLKRLGIWLFIVGSFLMLVGAVGQGLVRYARD